MLAQVLELIFYRYSYWDAQLAARLSSALKRLRFLYRCVTLSHHMFAVEINIIAVPVL